MAYYQNAPKKKKKINYGETGSWDEEGSHYSDRRERPSRGKSTYESGSRKGSGRRDDSYSNRGDRNGSKRYEERDSSGYDRKRTDGSRAPGGRPDRGEGYSSRSAGPRREDFSPRKPQPPREEEGYRSYEYRKPGPETFDQNVENDHILCGRNPIREALRSGREIEKLLVQKGELSGSAKEIVMEAREKKIMVQEVDKRRLDEIALHHQGLIAFASAYHYAEIDEMLDEAERKQEAPFLVILDGVTDPHNLGAIIRTAECVGAHGVIIPIHRSVGLTPAAVKASAGAIEHTKVARVTNLNRTIDDLKRQGVWTYAVTMDGKDYEKVDFRGGCALVIGAEGEGISRLTAEKCDLSVSLPMKGELDSLNASVAAGVMMYRVLSSRRKG